MQLPALLRVRTSSGQTTRVPIDVDQYRPDEPFYESALCSKFGPGTWSRDPSGTTPIPQQTLLGELRLGLSLIIELEKCFSSSPHCLCRLVLWPLHRCSLSPSHRYQYRPLTGSWRRKRVELYGSEIRFCVDILRMECALIVLRLTHLMQVTIWNMASSFSPFGALLRRSERHLPPSCLV